MATAYITDSRFAAHTLSGHPEHAGRLAAIQRGLDENRLLERLSCIEPEPVTDEEMREVHTSRYLGFLASTVERPAMMMGPDTYILPDSYRIARLAAGGVRDVMNAVLTGQADNGLAAIRPPGHHATPSQGMGFCLLNNIAIAARCAMRQSGIKRILIVDYDVHHGNGTQDAFYDDSSVLYVSTHQWPLYPGTGDISDTGVGGGEGYTLNIPMPPGVGDEGYADVFEQIVVPAARRFAPELILVSVGFDAHWADPLANMQLSLAGYDRLARVLLTLARELCKGKIVFVLEGGYDLSVLAFGWANIARALLDDEPIPDTIGSGYGASKSVSEIIERVKRTHKIE